MSFNKIYFKSCLKSGIDNFVHMFVISILIYLTWKFSAFCTTVVNCPKLFMLCFNHSSFPFVRPPQYKYS